MMSHLLLILLVLSGLFAVLDFTYLSIRHDMDLITAKQDNLFEVFYQRARILAPDRLSRFVEESAIKAPIFSNGPDVTAYVYGYDLKDRHRLAMIPIMPAAGTPLATYSYTLSYPEVINLYAVFDNNQLFGIVVDDKPLPERLAPMSVKLAEFAPWAHYFGCPGFALNQALCSQDEAFVTGLEVDFFTKQETIVMFFPFVYYDEVDLHYRYGLLGIDLAVATAFHDALIPYEARNPTVSTVSFEPGTNCDMGQICLVKPLMSTKTGRELYLKWVYSYGDFLTLVLYGSALKLYVIAILLLSLSWRRLYQRIFAQAHTDQLTRLPRRDILDKTLLQEHDYLMLLDIDNFKSINDTYGHQVGDLALGAFAQHLKRNIRKGDTAIRWGGEEFIAIYKGLEDDKAMRHSANRLLAQPLQIPELADPITFSAGIIRIRDYLSVSEAVTLADELLYYVKRHGKHNIAYYQGQQIRLLQEAAPKGDSPSL